jgi:hypothetical protein
MGKLKFEILSSLEKRLPPTSHSPLISAQDISKSLQKYPQPFIREPTMEDMLKNTEEFSSTSTDIYNTEEAKQKESKSRYFDKHVLMNYYKKGKN